MNWVIALIVGFGTGYWMGLRAAASVQDPRKNTVVAMLDGKAEITNNDVERALGVSDATATRVLDVLEKSGDITQVGTTGSGVVYRKKY